MREIRCGGCNRLLALAGWFEQLQIKCPRCGALNHLKAESLLDAPVSAALGAQDGRKESPRP
jgi:phage FluMu protein Com